MPSADGAADDPPTPPPPPLAPPGLRPCPHQVAGHLWGPDGATPGALVDGAGAFYKPLQAGPRGERERAFYETVASAAAGNPAFAAAHAPLLAALPRFHGVVAWDDGDMPGTPPPPRRLLLALQDVAAGFARPCVLDVKVGARTWHAGCGHEERARRAAKDGATTQAALGWKVCGAQVWRGGGGSGEAHGRWWRAGKAWCKGLTPATAPAALAAFATGAPSGATPARVYGGPSGAAAAVRALAAWAAGQAAFAFHSASVLIVYEGGGGAEAPPPPTPSSSHGASPPPQDGLRVRVRLVDFAHTFVTDEQLMKQRPYPPAAVPHPSLVGVPDQNFAGGLAALAAALDAAAAGGVVGAGDLAGV